MCHLEYVKRIKLRQSWYWKEKTINYSLRKQILKLKKQLAYINSIITKSQNILEETRFSESFIISTITYKKEIIKEILEVNTNITYSNSRLRYFKLLIKNIPSLG